MANLRARYLSPEEIDEIVTPLLQERFRDYGFKGKSIEEHVTTDGDEPFIRVRADVDRAVPAEELVSAHLLVNAALQAQDEDRFVILTASGPSIALPGGDEDEEV
ncbi:hypothetical protein [Rhizobium sp.]|jgi:hypothetical protein|uniref:hypothetical protein n=1 Tax=Rhizobium sp. TaxID=391 RepID=UPI000E9AE0B9|nr:hypothetical protein [Rhizobium sp.]